MNPRNLLARIGKISCPSGADQFVYTLLSSAQNRSNLFIAFSLLQIYTLDLFSISYLPPPQKIYAVFQAPLPIDQILYVDMLPG